MSADELTCQQDQIIAAIVRLFSASSPCSEDLSEIVPGFWDLVGFEACFNTALRALLVKRETVLFLMGCEAYSVDTQEKHYRLDGLKKEDSESNLRAQSQSTGNSTRFQRAHGETRYDETSNGRTDARATRVMRGTEVGDGESHYRDDGRGGGFNNSGSSNEIEALEQRQHLNTIEAASQETGFRKDCNYEYSENRSNQASFLLPIIPLSIGAGATSSTSEWRKFTSTRASDEDSSFRERHQGNIHEIRDERTGRGSHTWQNNFFADVAWNERDYEIRRSRDRSDHRRDTEAHAQGNGDGFFEDRTTAHNAAQGTAKIEARMDHTRTYSRVSSRNEVSLAGSQRFRNLLNLYDQLTEQIAHLKRRLRQRATARIGQLPCNCQGCCTCMPRWSSCGLGGGAYSLCSLGRAYVGSEAQWH